MLLFAGGDYPALTHASVDGHAECMTTYDHFLSQLWRIICFEIGDRKF